MMLGRNKQLLVSSLLLFVGEATANCNVCRNGGAVTNPSHSFQMVDTANNQVVDWTCGWLEESVADVNPQGAQGEAFLCGLAQLWAEKECQCSGPPIAPLSDNVIDPNPACDLCQGSYDFNYVPAVLSEELVQTGIAGRMPCGGLYNALSEGVLPLSLCSTIRQNSAGFCCNAPTEQLNQIVPSDNNNNSNNSGGTSESDNSGNSNSGGSGTNSGCAGIHESCASDTCCSGFRCALRVLGEDPICSPINSRPRESVATGRGGAGGLAKGQS